MGRQINVTMCNDEIVPPAKVKLINESPLFRPSSSDLRLNVKNVKMRRMHKHLLSLSVGVGHFAKSFQILFPPINLLLQELLKSNAQTSNNTKQGQKEESLTEAEDRKGHTDRRSR